MARPPVGRAFIALAMLAVYQVHMLCYLSVAALTAHRPAHQLLLPGEARIPFAPEWGSVYVLAYVFPLVPIFTVRDGDRFARLMIAIGLTMLVAYSCFLAYPVVVPRPPLEVHSVGSYLLAVQYRWDEPRNAFPSLHVAFCWLFWLASRERAAWSVPLLAVVAAISVSTVLVRQHNVMDVLGGLVLAQAAWAAAGSLARRPATATGDRRFRLTGTSQSWVARRWTARWLEKVAGELMEKGGSGYWRGWTEFWRFIRDY